MLTVPTPFVVRLPPWFRTPVEMARVLPAPEVRVRFLAPVTPPVKVAVPEPESRMVESAVRVTALLALTPASICRMPPPSDTPPVPSDPVSWSSTMAPVPIVVVPE